MNSSTDSMDSTRMQRYYNVSETEQNENDTLCIVAEALRFLCRLFTPL